jgi:hypothetical protein
LTTINQVQGLKEYEGQEYKFHKEISSGVPGYWSLVTGTGGWVLGKKMPIADGS